MKPSQTIKINDDIWCPVTDLDEAVKLLEQRLAAEISARKVAEKKLSELDELYTVYNYFPEETKEFVACFASAINNIG